MRRSPLLAPLLLTTLVASSSAQDVVAGAGQVFTIDHYAKVARVSDVRVAPAGDRAVMVVAWPNYHSNAWDSELVQVDLRTRNQRTMTRRKTASSPRWSPSGNQLAFLARVDDKAQIFVMAADGGEARQVTKAPNGVRIFAWKPDETGFAFAAGGCSRSLPASTPRASTRFS